MICTALLGGFMYEQECSFVIWLLIWSNIRRIDPFLCHLHIISNQKVINVSRWCVFKLAVERKYKDAEDSLYCDHAQLNKIIYYAHVLYSYDACSVAAPQYFVAYYHKPFWNLHQEIFNILLSDTSFFPRKPTWEIILPTESLYNHMGLREICPFMKGSEPTAVCQTGPSGTAAVWLGSLTGPGYSDAVVRSHWLRNCRYFLPKFLCRAVAVIFTGRLGNMN